MLCIYEPRNIEEYLIVSVGIEVSRVSNGSITLDAIDRVTDVRAGGKDEGGFDDVKGNIPGLNRCSCGSSQRVRVNFGGTSGYE